MTGGSPVAAHLGLAARSPGQAGHADAYFTQAAGRALGRPHAGMGGGGPGPHEVALFRPDGQVRTLRYAGQRLSGETSGKKPMRRIGTRTVGDSLAFLTCQPIPDS
ncbi:MAG: hypothetical protein ACRDPD_09085 [Streptosporangiaceae bacterium]